MTQYRVKGKYDFDGDPAEAIKSFVAKMQLKAYDEGHVDGFFEVVHENDSDYLSVIFKRDLESDREYALERSPHDLQSGLLKQLHAELVEGNMPPVSLEWISETQKAFRVVQRKLHWTVNTYEPVLADDKEKAQEAVETGCTDESYQGSDDSPSIEVIYEVTRIEQPIPEKLKPRCPMCYSEQVNVGMPLWVARSTDSPANSFSAILNEYRCEGCGRAFFVSDDDLEPQKELSSDQVHAV
jgi:hypothetical protein